MDKFMYGTLILEDKTRFKIRLDAKPVTDTHMVYESWGRLDYTPVGLKINRNFCVIDIGAHIGSFTVLAAKCADRGQVYSYEPYPENFNLLQENVSINKLKNVKTFNVAVGGHGGKAKLYIDVSNPVHSLFRKTNKTMDVSVTTLKSIFEDNKLDHCDFLKIDCEGAEYEILLNTPPEIMAKIHFIVLEYHDQMYKGKDKKDLQGFLRKQGFKVKLHTFLPPPQDYQGLLYANKP